MNQLMMQIGTAVLTFFRTIDLAGIRSALSIMGIGMLGIFLVTGVIILVITLLTRIFSR